MSLRFFRRVKVAPGVTLNFGKSGLPSMSFGTRGLRYTTGTRGQRVTAGLPGTGVFYTKQLSSGSKTRRSSTGGSRRQPAPPPPTLVPRMFAPRPERKLVEACQALREDQETKAWDLLQEASELPDGAYLAGFVALQRRKWDEAERFLTQAGDSHKELGKTFGRYHMSPQLRLKVTDEIAAVVPTGLPGVLLGLVEVYQILDRRREAMECLEALLKLDDDDLVVRLSLAEFLMETRPAAQADCQKVIKLAQGVENESEIHAALLLYRARALVDLGMMAPARDALTLGLRRRKDRPPQLMHALRYERARVYENMRQRARARTEYQKLYAEDPAYEDVAQRLGF